MFWDKCWGETGVCYVTIVIQYLHGWGDEGNENENSWGGGGIGIG